MTIKKLFAPLFALLLATIAPLRAQLLWEISGEGLEQPSYLFGTIHIQDGRVFQFSDSVFIAMNSCEVFASEIELGNSNALALSQHFLLPADSTLRDIYTPEEYMQIKEAVEEHTNQSMAIVDHLKPIAVIGLLTISDSVAGNAPPVAMDIFLFQEASKRDKLTVGIETVEEQMAVLDLMPKEALLDHIDQLGEADPLYDRLINAYRHEELDTLHQLIASEMDSAPDSTANAFYDALMPLRNHKMATRIAKLIEQRSAFVAIGAGHLAGNDGVVNLLRENGFTVKPIMGMKHPKND